MNKENIKDKVVVTGGSGFIGSHLVDALIEAGFEVHSIDRTAKKSTNSKVILHQADIADLDTIRPIIAGSRFVFHLAGIPGEHFSVEHPDKSNTANVTGTLNVLIASAEANVERLINASSASVYGNQDSTPFQEDMPPHPRSPYAIQKYTGELYCNLWSEHYALPTVSLRYFSVYGPRICIAPPKNLLLIDQFLKNKKEGKPHCIIGDGSQTRDLIHVRDVVRATILAMQSKQVGEGEVINIGTGRNIHVNEIAELIGGKTEHIPFDTSRPQDTLADISKALKLLGWEPTILLEDGIRELETL